MPRVHTLEKGKNLVENEKEEYINFQSNQADHSSLLGFAFQ